ncbi:aldehyde dehydrogenase [Pusillimonas sp. ANT_WB101]|uniref:aldehyde dehydrogenase n=1 Tax=Pusillimonas sp. ANT_WB101 TaxID=2597356 RepID=UPI0011EBA110|nr:aldehyde dehydrogenase [Pusillimonas sp. ANT_WB101]KAA0910674.1 aldehyde dehydrogenase [Pusillimonas sp. ANT_WB101]
MSIFKVFARDGSITLVIRARCISCARQLAAERSPAAEFALWVNKELSGVEWMPSPEAAGYLSDGKTGIIERVHA